MHHHRGSVTDIHRVYFRIRPALHPADDKKYIIAKTQRTGLGREVGMRARQSDLHLQVPWYI